MISFVLSLCADSTPKDEGAFPSFEKIKQTNEKKTATVYYCPFENDLLELVPDTAPGYFVFNV